MKDPEHSKEGLTRAEQARLVQALQRRERAPHVPEEIDSLIRDRTRRHFANGTFASKPRVIFSWIRLGWAAGLAGAIVVAALLAPSLLRQRKMPPPITATAPGDLDRNGRVDILDALFLARRLESGKPVRDDGDFNGDGAVDEGDVRGIAIHAVQLNSREEG